MSTKTQLQTLINTNLADGILIEAPEHREVENGLLNEMFPTANIQEVVSNGANFNYKISFNKIGNLVFINGFIKNETNNIINSQTILTISDALYYGKTGANFMYNIKNIILNIGTSVMFLTGNIGIGETIYINEIYQTND